MSHLKAEIAWKAFVAFANIVVHEHLPSGSGDSFAQREEISDFISYSAGVETLLNMITGFHNLKRLLDMWDRNGSTSGPTPWQIYDDDDGYLSHYTGYF